MATTTLTIPDEVKNEMKKFSWVNWSEVAREEIIESAKREERFERFNKYLKDSELDDDTIFKLADKLKAKV